jgi:hypothetical protein
LSATDAKILQVKATDPIRTVLVRISSPVYCHFLKNFKPRTSQYSEKNWKQLLEKILPECNDLDSYKLKQKYFRLPELEFHPAKTVLGHEAALLDKVSVVISGTVDVYRMIKKNSEVRSYAETVPINFDTQLTTLPPTTA